MADPPHTSHGRKEWAERTPSWTLLGPVRDVVFHHDVYRYQATFEPSTMRGLERAELSRGGYIAVAYHTLIPGNGDLVECRPGHVMGGATKGHNATSRAIVFPGNYSPAHGGTDVLTDEQILGAAEQIAVWVRAGLVHRNFRVFGHLDLFPTACPSAPVYGRLHGMWSIEFFAHAKLEGSSTPITPGPPPPALPPAAPGVDWVALGRWIEGLRASIRRNPLTPATRGSRPHETKLVQNRLVKLGYSVGSAGVDGDYGPATVRAVRGFQRAARIREDGIVGPITLARLGA